MDLIAPDGCGSEGRGWSGAPLDTAHLRLRPDSANPQVILIEDRVKARICAAFQVSAELRGHGSIAISQAFDGQNSKFPAESAHRCLRMLFDDYGCALVEEKNTPENQDLIPTLQLCGATLGPNDLWQLTAASWRSWRKTRKILQVVAIALVDPDGRVLLTERPAGKSMAEQWEFPGGKLDPGETPEEALLRELREELALELSASCLAPLAFASHDYDHFHLVMPLYIARQWQGRPVPQEGQRMAWVSKDRLGDYVMPPADIPLIAQLRDWL
jgi:8-oxo-dGTP diphosphatase